MRLKCVLLGSAMLSGIAAAEASDLTLVEPVDSVRVCDAFGAGFFYSPGTDTCIKIGGYVKFGTSIGHSDFGSYNLMYPGSRWSNFFTETSMQVTASTVTEYGNLTGFIDMRAQSGNEGSFGESLTQATNSVTNTSYLDSAYLQLGPLQAGFFTSLFDFGRGYTDTGAFGSDSTTDHIALTYTLDSFGLSLSVEDQRDRGAVGSIPLTSNQDMVWAVGGQPNIPDIVAAATYASGIISAKMAAAYVNQAMDRTGTGAFVDPFTYSGRDGWAIGGSAQFALDKISAGDMFFVSAAYGDNANSFTGISGGTAVAGIAGFKALGEAAVAEGTSWSALASYKHVWTPAVWSAVSGGYATYSGAGEWRGSTTLDAWRIVGSTGWDPVEGLNFMLDGQYSSVQGTGDVSDGDAWAVNLWVKRVW